MPKYLNEETGMMEKCSFLANHNHRLLVEATMRNWIQHNCNSLHVYCRLRPVFGKRTARMLGQFWERMFHRSIYAGGIS